MTAFINTARVDGSASSAGTIVLPAIAASAGNMVVAGFAWLDAGNSITISSVTDSSGNTWRSTTKQNSASTSSQVWYCENVAAAGSLVITATLSASTTFRTGTVAQYSGIISASDPLDTAVLSNGSSAAPTSAAFTTTQDQDLVVAFVTNGTGITAPYGYTNRTDGNYGSLTDSATYAVQAAATAALTTAGSYAWNMHLLAFKVNVETPTYSNNWDSETTGVLPTGWANKVGTWVVGTTAPVSGAKTLGSSSNGDGDVVLYTAASPTADMRVETLQSVVASGANFPVIGHVLRANSSNSDHYLVLRSIGGQCVIFKKVSGTYTQIYNSGVVAAFAIPSAGSVVSMWSSVVGSTISVGFMVNAKPIGTSASVTDTSITAAGYAGLYNSKDGLSVTMGSDNYAYFDLSPDATPPTLTSPTASSTGNTTGTGSVVTNESSGTLYALASTNATETAATVKAGGGTQTVSAAGTLTADFTGLSPGTTYYAHFVHRDAAGNDSTVANSTSFTTSSGAATGVTMTGPSSGYTSVASSNFTVGANGTITGTVVVTPSDGGAGGTFTPTTVSINTGSPSGTFTYTAASAGSKTISVTNNGGLSNPSNITYTAASASLYTRVDATDTFTGQNIMVLVPGGSASTPYNPANPTKVVLYAHGAGETQTALLSDSLKLSTVNALLDAGYILAGSNQHGENWGSQAAVDDFVALEKYVRDNYNVAGVCVWSQSMGGMSGLLAVAQGKFRPLGWLGTYPVVSLASLYGLGTFTSAINTAYGITGSGIATYANKTRGHDPALLEGFSWRHIPMRLYASSGDTVVPKAANGDVLAALVAGCCREAVMVACTGNHGDASHFVPAEYVAFFNRCFATPVAKGKPASTRTVSLTLTTDGTTPASGLTGLSWSWWDQVPPNTAEYPTDKGTGATTNGSGVLSLAVASDLAAAATGWLVVTNSDGTVTQSPAASAFSGPVVVA